MQLKRHSFIESITNVVCGYGIAVTTQVIVFPWFGLKCSLENNLKIGMIFTVVSIARSYALRRIFNWLADVKE